METKNEKVKKIRKILLLKINDELKDILKYKSNIKINSKTIQEINKLYTLNDIQLFEKPALYSHYVKTEETVVPKIERPQIKMSKSVNKIRSKKKSRVVLNTEKEKKSSIEEDLASPLNSFFPKKIELGRRKINKSKNKGSIPNIQHKGILIEKYNDNRRAKMSQSTRMNKRDLHLNRLIGRITIIKDYKINEDIIKASIKKLRNYCYQLRKKKKRPKKIDTYNIKKSIDRGRGQKRNAIKGTGLLKKSDTLTKKSFFQNYINISKKNMVKLPNLNISNKTKKLSKISLKSISPSKHEDKVNKVVASIVKNRKNKNRSKKSNKNSIKTTINMTTFEGNEVPDVFQIHKKNLPFFHKTTVLVNDEDVPEIEKRERKKSDKRNVSKDLSRQRKKSKMLDNPSQTEQKQDQNNSIIQRRKSKMLDNPPQLDLKPEINNTGNKFLGLIHQRKKSKMLDNPPQIEQKQELIHTGNKFLGLDYVYNRNNNKKSTKIEMKRIPSDKKMTKIETRKNDFDDNDLAIIKLTKVNNGEMTKKVKKKQIKEKKLVRNSYISYVSNKTDTNGYRSKQNLFQKSANKK